MATFLPSSFPIPSSLESILLVLIVLSALTALISHFLLKPKLRLPPSPPAVPFFGNWLQVGDDLNHENLSLLAKTYGPVFLLRLGRRNVVVVSSPDLAKEVLHTHGVEFGSRTRNVVLDLFTGKGQDMVFSEYGDHWRKMRRIMTVPFFTTKVVQQSSGRWCEEIDSAIADVKANPAAGTTGIVVRRRLQLLMYNNLYRVMFDRRFETEDDPLYLELRRLNDERSRLAQSLDYNYGDFIPIFRPFIRGYLQHCQKVKDERLALFKKYFVDERRKLTSMKTPACTQGKCAIDHILDAQKNDEITEENLLYIIENVNVAAIETTLWSMEWALAELVNNPDIQKRLRDELNKELGAGVLPTEPDLPKLRYLLAVVKESMRLHMAIPLLVPHMNLHQAQLAGYDIPAGTRILVNAWYLANNPEWWEKPDVFNPDRFLGPDKIDANGNDFRFLPFGVGRRSCPGIVLAMPMVSLLLGSLVQAFELLPPPGQSKLDLTGNGGQFSWKIANHSVVVCKPL